MLVSPLMGPVMSITFGVIVSDRELVVRKYLFIYFSKNQLNSFLHSTRFQKVGFISLALGMFISVLFGFIFGLILGTTDMPWGFGDFPTEEMKGR